MIITDITLTCRAGWRRSRRCGQPLVRCRGSRCSPLQPPLEAGEEGDRAPRISQHPRPRSKIQVVALSANQNIQSILVLQINDIRSAKILSSLFVAGAQFGRRGGHGGQLGEPGRRHGTRDRRGLRRGRRRGRDVPERRGEVDGGQGLLGGAFGILGSNKRNVMIWTPYLSF